MHKKSRRRSCKTASFSYSKKITVKIVEEVINSESSFGEKDSIWQQRRSSNDTWLSDDNVKNWFLSA